MIPGAQHLPPALRILLAEDNEVNQKLAVRILEKRGHSVLVVSNGREALAALAKESFDLALMDVQMPEMGGFEATAAIREQEKQSGKHLPIVAMTAHAMKGDRERCLEAGMDGYVTKPIQPQMLFEAIEQAVSLAPLPSPHAEILDRPAVLKRVGGDRQLLRELIDLFLEDCPEHLSAIRDAVARRDGETLERAAHKLKGSVSNFEAGDAVEAALRLETMGRENELTEVEAACAALEASIERLRPALSALKEEEE